tara:strand:- start:2469 stop:2825 length:357 start_codon:yes stop_codon:yes gene_type:complete
MAENPVYESPPPTQNQSAAGYLANRGKAARDALSQKSAEQEEESKAQTVDNSGQLGGIIASLAALLSQNYAAIPAAYGVGKTGTEAVVAGLQGDPKTALNKGMYAASGAQSIYEKQKA